MITDEQLSAFLDAELPVSDMTAISQQLASEPALQQRLAQLTTVMSLVRQHSSAIEDMPLPAKTQQLLEQFDKQTSNENVVPLQQRNKAPYQLSLATAASVALLAGFGLAQLFTVTPQNNLVEGNWIAVVQVLENSVSGQNFAIDDDTLVQPLLTFINKQQQYCRQYKLTAHSTVSDNIACRQNGGWQQVAFIVTAAAPQKDELYYAASNSSMIDVIVDDMLEGQIIEPDVETQLLQAKWQSDK